MDYKYIVLDNQATSYRIYPNGGVMNEKTGRYCKGIIVQGYRWFDLRHKRKKFRKSQHRLLAQAFIENPMGLPYVHHIDGNRLNNRLENLCWVTAHENNLAPNRHSRNIVDLQNDEPENQVWRTFRDTIYSVSNYGRVRNNLTNKIMKGKITDTGYREYCLTIGGRKASYFAHRLVWEVWQNEKPNVIRHKDGNKLNNCLHNLQNVTYQQNAIYVAKAHKYKKTAQYDSQGNLVRVYENNVDAARAMHVRPQSIQNAIQNHRKSCGFYWDNLQE